MSRSKVKKAVKNSHPITLILGIVFLIIGAVAGFFTCKIITKNDTFELIGESQINIAINGDTTYVDAGVTCVAFGRDESDKVVVKTNMTQNADGSYTIDTSTQGEYYIIYTVEDSLRYNDIQRVRVITVGGTNE